MVALPLAERGGARGPVLRWPGAKWQAAPWIVDQLPPHRVYCEPFAGSGAVLLHKPRAAFELLNDLDGRIVNLFRVMRERPDELAAALALTPYARAEYRASLAPDVDADPVEAARVFVVRAWGDMGTVDMPDTRAGWRRQMRGRGSIAAAWYHLPDRVLRVADRLASVQIDQRPALELIAELRGTGATLYVDPPYLLELRDPRLYGALNLSDAEHVSLLELLRAHDGPVLLSGYPHPLYDELLGDWERRTKRAKTRKGTRLEALYMNAAATSQGRLW